MNCPSLYLVCNNRRWRQIQLSQTDDHGNSCKAKLKINFLTRDESRDQMQRIKRQRSTELMWVTNPGGDRWYIKLSCKLAYGIEEKVWRLQLTWNINRIKRRGVLLAQFLFHLLQLNKVHRRTRDEFQFHLTLFSWH